MAQLCAKPANQGPRCRRCTLTSSQIGTSLSPLHAHLISDGHGHYHSAKCVAARTPGQGRGTVAGRAGAAAVSHQELGVAPTGLAQGAHGRGAGQGRDGADPGAGGDEVSVTVGPGQRRTRSQAGRGIGHAAGFGAADGEAVCRVPRSRCGWPRATVQFASGISTDGGAERARGRRTVHRRRSVGLGSRCHCRIVRTRPSSSMHRDLHRGNRRGAGSDRGGDGRSTRGVCNARAGAWQEARP